MRKLNSNCDTKTLLKVNIHYRVVPKICNKKMVYIYNVPCLSKKLMPN